MVDVSIIFPSRQRTKKLASLLDSLIETTANIHRVEVLVAVDVDDDETLLWIPKNPLFGPFTKFYIRPRAKNFSDEYFNYLCKQSAGRYVMALNDDVRFLTRGWDDLAVSHLDAAKERYTDGCILGRCGDGYGAMYPCFPILSREAVEVQGYFFHPGFTAWGADIHLHRLWSAIGRVVDLPFDVDHVSHHTHAEEVPDEVHIRMSKMSKYAHETVGPEVVRITKALKEKVK